MVKKHFQHVFLAFCLIQLTLLQASQQSVSSKVTPEIQGELILAAKENDLAKVEKFIKDGATQDSNKVILALSHAAKHANKVMIFVLLRAGVTPGKYFWLEARKNKAIWEIVEQYNQETEKVIYQESLQVLQVRDVAGLVTGYAVEPVEEQKAILL